MQAIIFALISFVGWGIGVLIEVIAARKLRPHSLVFWSFLVTIIITSFYVPFALKDLANLTFELLSLIIIIGIIGIFSGTIMYFEALNMGNAALVGTIASSFPAVAVILSIAFLGEKVQIRQVLAILVIFIGIFLASFNINKIHKLDSFINKANLFALLTMLSWGTFAAFIKIPVQKIGWFWPNYITYLLLPLVCLYIYIRRFKIEKPTKNGALVPLVVSTVLVGAAELSYNFAISKGLVTIVAPIAGANPTLFVILAFLFFKDPITKQQILGIIITLLGIVLLSIFSI